MSSAEIGSFGLEPPSSASLGGPALLLCALGAAIGCGTEAASGQCAAGSRVCPRAEVLRGIDVSAYQGEVRWEDVRADGNAFAFVRVSDGLSRPDAAFAANWPRVRAVGLVRGVYQFFRPTQDPVLQAELLLRRVDEAGGFASGDLPPVLDLETTEGLGADVVIAASRSWLSVVEARLGARPLVYTAPSMSGSLCGALASFPLFVANYRASCPAMPAGWTAWKFWQQGNDGRVRGVSGAVDTDLFDGDAEDLAALGFRVSGP